MTKAVRGAIQVQADDREAIERASARLIAEILRANSIDEAEIVSILFSLTKDLRAGNPATGLRRVGFAATPLFCLQEADVEGSMPRVLRALVTWETARRAATVPVYLDGAEMLRADLTQGKRG
jgi:chorismate mutase